MNSHISVGFTEINDNTLITIENDDNFASIELTINGLKTFIKLLETRLLTELAETSQKMPVDKISTKFPPIDDYRNHPKHDKKVDDSHYDTLFKHTQPLVSPMVIDDKCTNSTTYSGVNVPFVIPNIN